MSNSHIGSHEQGSKKLLFHVSADDFKKIPGSPVAYWVDQEILDLFSVSKQFCEDFHAKQGIATGKNEIFLRSWHEVSFKSIGFPGVSGSELFRHLKWFPYSKGGEARRWYGNNELIVDWADDGRDIKNFKDESGKSLSRPQNLSFQFREAVTWSLTSSSNIPLCARYRPAGYLFDINGMSAFPKSDDLQALYSVGLLNSYVPQQSLQFINPTMAFQSGDISRIPLPKYSAQKTDLGPAASCVDISRSDWDRFETSWDFLGSPLINEFRSSSLRAGYNQLRAYWCKQTSEMQRMELENNVIFANAYGLKFEQKFEVPLSAVTLNCNPYYRYGSDKTEDELENLLLADTMRELVSYAVGCMLGRYSLDKPGLILANQGETLADYLAQVPQPCFPADDDNVIPVLDGDWFADDITLRFRQFLRVAFGEERYEDNLAFIEQALNIKGKRNYSLRDYFLGEFYADHVKRYKKRPIYWLFSSPKGSFNALIYMHRYRPDTVSVVLKYLRDYREKLSTEKERQASVSINPATSQGEKTKALKEVDRLAKVLTELNDYERDVLYPLATEQVQIDLDDGVKVNYLKFGTALKKIPGLDAKEED